MDQPDPPLGPITAAEFRRMCDAGVFALDAHVELLDGYVIEMPPPSPAHAYGASALTAIFVRALGDRAWVTSSGALHLGERSEVQPDVMLCVPPGTRYARAHPTPEDALLVIEVSRSALWFDLRRKRVAYARAGMREYWVVDLVNERVDVFRDPRDGDYMFHRTVPRGEAIAPAAFADVSFAVDTFLPAGPA